MDLGLQGKVVLITGGSRGIGRGIAQALSEEGARVVICARGEGVLGQAASEINAATGNEVVAIPTDLTIPEHISRLANDVLNRFGRVDVLINNAGSSVFGYYDELSDEDWSSSFELKFFSYVRLTQLLVLRMQQQGSGVIINVVGNAGRVPMDWHMPGGAANAALLNYTKSLSNQVGKHGVRVIAVNPGPTETDRWDSVLRFFAKHTGAGNKEVRESVIQRIPLRRFATVEDIAYTIAFLASDKASFITGTSITVDGGMAAVP